LEPINVPHHIIPGTPPPAPSAASTAARGGVARAAAKTAGEIMHHASIPHIQGGGLFPILAATGLVLGSIALAILLLRTVRATRVQEALAEKPSRGLRGYGYYVYQGLRAALREIFIGLKERASALLGTPLTAATPREVAKALRDSAALEFARRYEALMYGPSEPEDNDVAELEAKARRILEGAKGREHG
jgi:hypothetical protein